MKKRGWAVILSLALLLMLSTPYAGASGGIQPTYDREEFPYEGYLVGVAQGDVAVMDTAAYVEPVIPGVYLADTAEDVAMVESTVAVTYVEPNYIVTLNREAAAENEEDDPQWSYHMVGGDYGRQLGLTGRGVRVAIIDSGIDPKNANLLGADIETGQSYLAGDSGTGDGYGHGTKVAQVIAGRGVRGAVQGIAPEATLVPLRCFDSNGQQEGDWEASVAVLARAVLDASAKYDCKVINMSWGSPVQSMTLKQATADAARKGAILIAAGGNGIWYDEGPVMYPAGYPDVVGVGSLSKSGAAASSSIQSRAVYVSAPGEWIPFIETDGRTKADSGTSFAAPAVVGVAALAAELVPELTAFGFAEVLRQRAVKNSSSSTEQSWDPALGYGLAELSALLGTPWWGKDGQRLVGWLPNEGGGTVVRAGYSPSGRMISCDLRSFTGGILGLSVPAEAVQGEADVKIFLLDRDNAPLHGFIDPDSLARH